MPLPIRKEGAVGFDFYCREQTTVPAGSVALVPSNAIVAVPRGYTLLVFMRSTVPLKKGLTLANGVGVVDPFFSGNKSEIMLQLRNFTDADVAIERGERLAQGIIVKHELVEWEEVDDMGSGGQTYRP